MTEEERGQWRQYKANVVQQLQAGRDTYNTKYHNALVDTDKRIGDYVFGVIDNPEAHNLYEILGVQRFLQMLDKYEWKAKKVRHFFRFYETIRFSGLRGRTRYKLTPVQAYQFANIYGFARADGRRLIRTAYLFVPRKFSKTTSCAAMAVYDMLFGDNNAQAYVGANSYDQAKICFDEIRSIMFDIDPREKHFKVNREKITFKDHGRDSLIQCLTANAKTKDGLFASLVIMDEYAQARNTAGRNGADLKNVLTTSMGPRREPLTIVITTASEVVDGPFAHELEGVMAVLRGEAESDTMFASIFMPDVDDAENDPATWAKVQPHLGITVQSDYYENEWENAQLSAENMLAFRLLLNKIVCGVNKVNNATNLVGPFVAMKDNPVLLSAVPTYKELNAEMKAAELETGIDGTNLCWVMTKSMEAILEGTPINENGVFLPMIQNGMLCGLPVYTSNVIRDVKISYQKYNGTSWAKAEDFVPGKNTAKYTVTSAAAVSALKGMVSGDYVKIVEGTEFIGLGDWRYQPMGLFGSLRFIVDPYSKARKDCVDFVLNADYATKTLRPEAFKLGKVGGKG